MAWDGMRCDGMAWDGCVLRVLPTIDIMAVSYSTMPVKRMRIDCAVGGILISSNIIIRFHFTSPELVWMFRILDL